MDESASARVLREQARMGCSRRLSKSLYDHGLTHEELSRHCGTTRQKVTLWCDWRRPEVPGVADILQMPHLVAIDMLRWAAKTQSADVVDHLDGASDIECHLQHLHMLIEELHELPKVYAQALATHGGHITDDELRAIHEEAADARRAALKTERWAEEELARRSGLRAVH